MYKINEITEIFNISKRTLYYYDEIGLLKVNKKSNGYREYSELDIDKLTKILIYKELEIPLKKIKGLLDSDKNFKVLKEQKKIISSKIKKYELILETIDEIIKGEKNMRKISKIFNMEIHTKHIDETKESYGNTKEYNESNKRWSTYSKNEQNEIINKGNSIFNEISQNMNKNINDDIIQNLIYKYQIHVSKYFYELKDDIYLGLSDLYITNEKFKNNFEKIKPGLSKYISDAIKYYIQNK